MFDDLTRAAS